MLRLAARDYFLMSALKLTLKQLEARIEALVEGSTARLFPGSRAPHQLTQRLLAAMRSAAQTGPDGLLYAPDVYFLLCHPSQADGLRADRVFLEELANLLVEAAVQSGLTLSGLPLVRVDADPLLAPGEFQVAVHSRLHDLSPTSGVAVDLFISSQAASAKAFLIVNGVQVFALDQPVINIGRRPDNQLVILDQRVSRLHAQLRYVQGHFVIFDLDSSGGTWVNGQRIRQHALLPGDVISLAGVPLVFGQETSNLAETQELLTNKGQS
jgi:hypothetical protein